MPVSVILKGTFPKMMSSMDWRGHGTLTERPVFNKDEWQWKYYIATESVDGDDILIIIAVDTLNRSFEVITRWRK